MLIRIIQALIVGAVIASNIQWKWTPSGLLAAIMGAGAAYVLTVVPVGIYHECRILWAQRKATREWKAKRLRRQAEAELKHRDDYPLPPAQRPVGLRDRQE